MVLDRDGGVDDVGRNVAEGHHDPVVTLVADIGQQVAPAVENVLREPAG